MTAIAYDYPTSAELFEIEQQTLPQLESSAASPFLENFPDEPHEDTVIMWEQLDNFTGLMNFRGYDNKPGRVKDIGARRFMTTPGVYGEYKRISEEQLSRRRQIGQFRGKVDVSDLTGLAQRQLLVRRLQRKEQILSSFVTTGTYSVPDGSGVNFTGDGFTPQSYSPATYAWSDHANSTPLYDLMQIALVPFGQSVSVGPESEFVINRLKFNDLVLNRNSADFWGYRAQYGSTTGNSLESINAVFMSQGLPRIRVYDGFYLADNGTRTGSPTRFVPTANGVLFAKRSNGSKPGGFAMTWNAEAGGPKPYTFVKVSKDEVPTTIDVHDGFNGGPLIRYPGTIVVASGL